MAFNVAEFRANMIGDGARPNLFSVSLVFPTLAENGALAGQKVNFMAKAVQQLVQYLFITLVVK